MITKCPYCLKEFENVNKGKPLSEEHKRKISLALKGRVFTSEWREKISKAMTGKPNWRKGKKWSRERRLESLAKRCISVTDYETMFTTNKKKPESEYYLLNRDKILIRVKARYQIERLVLNSNPLLLAEHNRKRRLHYRKNHDRLRLQERIREARKRANGGVLMDYEWEELLNQYSHQCAYCGNAENLTIDHVIPISRSGLHIKENIVPACYTCNVKKNARTAEEFIEQEAEYLKSDGKLIFPLPQVEVISK